MQNWDSGSEEYYFSCGQQSIIILLSRKCRQQTAIETSGEGHSASNSKDLKRNKFQV